MVREQDIDGFLGGADVGKDRIGFVWRERWRRNGELHLNLV